MCRAAKVSIVLFLFLSTACAEIPKEVVELSYGMGQDLNAVHQSYRELITSRFEDFRRQRLEYVNNRWAPEFIRGWVKKGRLVEVAKGEVVFSTELNDFVRPDPDRAEQQMLRTVNLWSRTAIAKIEEKKKSLIDPLNADEKELLATVDTAFERLYIANTTITAHLNSIREVKEVQDDALKALNLKELQEKINDLLVKASDKAAAFREDVEKAEGKIEGFSD